MWRGYAATGNKEMDRSCPEVESLIIRTRVFL